MISWTRYWLHKASLQSDPDYRQLVDDLLASDVVRQMDQFIHHGRITCLEHSLAVSYFSFRISRRLGLDTRSIVRGALLHDLYLYDWHIAGSHRGLHGFSHPATALRNAAERFDLNRQERDIILKHMWPLTWRLPACKESWIVTLADKYCAIAESIGLHRRHQLLKLKRQLILTTR